MSYLFFIAFEYHKHDKTPFSAYSMPKLWNWICLIRTVNIVKQLNCTFMTTTSSELLATLHYWMIYPWTIDFPILWKHYFILFPVFSYKCEIKAVRQELPHVPSIVFTKTRESGHSDFAFPLVTILPLQHWIHSPPNGLCPWIHPLALLYHQFILSLLDCPEQHTNILLYLSC